MKFNLVILDLDVLVYKCGFSIEKYDKETEITSVEPIHHAYHNLKSMINKCLELSNCSNYKGYLTASRSEVPENFRFGISRYYKENRVKCAVSCDDPHPYDCNENSGHQLIGSKPVYYSELRDYLCNRYNAKIITGQEADDSCSIEQCNNNSLGFDPSITNSIIWSIDKDFKNVPGYHGNYNTGNVVYISPFESLQNFYLQILTGDTSDGIPRIEKGWKQKKAENLIKKAKTEQELLEIVYNECSSILKLEEVELKKIILDRARLVWLRRKENEMWELPKF